MPRDPMPAPNWPMLLILLWCAGGIGTAVWWIVTSLAGN